MTVGTSPCTAPEQSLADAAADVYALACVLHELLTGKPLFTPDDSRSHMWHHVHTPAPPVRTLSPDLPADIENLLPAMLAMESEQRTDAMAARGQYPQNPAPYGQDPGHPQPPQQPQQPPRPGR
ncbi:hypothetical protein [Streptomyces sp. CB03911]|uniref:hypothetical protein n=1 Tax=Streptomycetaceae TaxID=2062 RepID=UPI00256FC70B|nr:hypothetical protein [Streptomyces sp. CB03911]